MTIPERIDPNNKGDYRTAFNLFVLSRRGNIPSDSVINFTEGLGMIVDQISHREFLVEDAADNIFLFLMLQLKRVTIDGEEYSISKHNMDSTSLSIYDLKYYDDGVFELIEYFQALTEFSKFNNDKKINWDDDIHLLLNNLGKYKQVTFDEELPIRLKAEIRAATGKLVYVRTNGILHPVTIEEVTDKSIMCIPVSLLQKGLSYEQVKADRNNFVEIPFKHIKKITD